MRIKPVVLFCTVLALTSAAALAAPNGHGTSANPPDQSRDSAETIGDQDEALKSVESGRAEPLDKLIQHLDDRLDGRVIDAKLMKRGSKEIYDLTVVSNAGVVHHVIVDAKTGAPL